MVKKKEKVEKKEKVIKKQMKFVWERVYYKDGGTVTSQEWDGKAPKEDVMDCIEDLMERGGITLIDLLKKFSPKKR